MPGDQKHLHVVLCCATARGLRFLRALAGLVGSGRLTVVSFPEEPWEPSYFSAISAEAGQLGAAFFKSRRLSENDLRVHLQENPADLLFAVSWRYIIPEEIFSAATIGSFVLHDSLLPRNRGFSPTVWAIVKGEDHTGVTLLEMAREVDAGDIVDQERVPIGCEEYIDTVMERVTGSYLQLLERNYRKLTTGAFQKKPQDEALATCNAMLTPADFAIDWRQPARQALNMIRAYSRPYPGAFTRLDGQILRIWRAVEEDAAGSPVTGAPGVVTEVRDDAIVIQAGDRAIAITEFELEGSAGVRGDLSPGATILGRQAG